MMCGARSVSAKCEAWSEECCVKCEVWSFKSVSVCVFLIVHHSPANHTHTGPAGTQRMAHASSIDEKRLIVYVLIVQYFSGIFPCKPTILDTPIYGTPHITLRQLPAARERYYWYSITFHDTPQYFMMFPHMVMGQNPSTLVNIKKSWHLCMVIINRGPIGFDPIQF